MEKTTEEHGAPGKTNQLPEHAVTEMPLCIQTGSHAAIRPKQWPGPVPQESRAWTHTSTGHCPPPPPQPSPESCPFVLCQWRGLSSSQAKLVLVRTPGHCLAVQSR